MELLLFGSRAEYGIVFQSPGLELVSTCYDRGWTGDGHYLVYDVPLKATPY